MLAVAALCSLTGLAGSASAQAEAPTAAQAAPALPGYFSATSADAARPSWPDQTGAGAGVWATPAGDGKGDSPASQALPELYDRVAHNLFSINMVWTLVTGFLVMFMQAGFMFVETGLCRAKNGAHTSAMNFMVYPLGCLAFWAYGFAIGWGNWWNGPVPPGWYASLGPGVSVLNHGWGLGAALDAAGNATGVFTYGLIGLKGFFLSPAVGDVSVLALFFFMMVFMDTTATIPTGAMAERWAWKNFCLFSLWVALPYCIYANWVWGGGFLAQGGLNWGLGHGAVDFAGSGVVHGMGGIIALVGAGVIGPRIGKYVNGKPQAIPGHNVPMVVLGTFILAIHKALLRRIKPGVTVDQKRGIVFAATGSAASDFYGVNRIGDNLFANSVPRSATDVAFSLKATLPAIDVPTPIWRSRARPASVMMMRTMRATKRTTPC